MTAPVDFRVAQSDRLSLGICLGFGVGTVGVSIMLNAVTAFFPAFMSTVLGQSPEIAGYLLMGSKLFDAIIDVLIGMASDRTRSRWGRRKPYLLAGGVLSSASFLMIFAPPALGQSGFLLYLIAALLLYSAAYSLFNVPYMAMPAELTQGFHERTRLISVRTVFVSIGQVLAVAGTAALVQHGGGGRHGYAMMALVMALIIGGAMTASALAVPPLHGQPAPKDRRRSAAVQFRLILANRPFMLLLGAKVFQFLSFASIASTGLLYMLNVVGVGYTGQIVLAITQNVSSAATMPLWVWLGRRIGKRQTYLIGVLLFCLTALSWFPADHGITQIGIVVRGIVSGGGSGAIILMSISMMGDTLAYDRLMTGEGREGLLASAFGVIEKASFALGVAVLGVFLHQFGYIPTMGGALVRQPFSALLALRLGYAVIPMAMFAVNGLFLWAYDLDEHKLATAQVTRAL